MQDLISVQDLDSGQIEEIFSLTEQLKKDKGKFSKSLEGKSLALIFQKPSNRTRVSFEVGMYQLGGHSLYLGPDEINLGVRESIKDVACTLSRYVQAIVLRTYAHQNLIEMAKYAAVPVINGLSDSSHPCQALADVFTIKEKMGKLSGVTLAYLGDGNNVCSSLLYTCAKSGVNMRVASPKQYAPDKKVFAEAKKIAQKQNASLELFTDAAEAAKDADVLYTDVWASMGQEKEAKLRAKVFAKFQINRKLMAQAKKNVFIMHCLPAHRGQEITDEVLDSPNSIVFDQAENRMHVQKAILMLLLT